MYLHPRTLSNEGKEAESRDEQTEDGKCEYGQQA